MGVGTSIAGNIAFKENATFVADRGAEVAMAYIKPPFPAPPTDTSADSLANGYWSSWVDGFDPIALPWGVRSQEKIWPSSFRHSLAPNTNTSATRPTS